MRSYNMETNRTITNAQYKQFDGVNEGIQCEIDGESWFVPLDVNNKDYAEILRQVEAGTLTIKDED